MAKLVHSTPVCVTHRHIDCTDILCDFCADVDLERGLINPRQCTIRRMLETSTDLLAESKQRIQTVAEYKLILTLQEREQESATLATEDGKHTYDGTGDEECQACSMSREHIIHWNDEDDGMQWDRKTGRSWKAADRSLDEDWWDDEPKLKVRIPTSVLAFFADHQNAAILTVSGAIYVNIRGVIQAVTSKETARRRVLINLMHTRRWEVAPSIGRGNGPVNHTSYVRAGYKDRLKAPAGGTYYWLRHQDLTDAEARVIIKRDYQ